MKINNIWLAFIPLILSVLPWFIFDWFSGKLYILGMVGTIALTVYFGDKGYGFGSYEGWDKLKKLWGDHDSSN